MWFAKHDPWENYLLLHVNDLVSDKPFKGRGLPAKVEQVVENNTPVPVPTLRPILLLPVHRRVLQRISQAGAQTLPSAILPGSPTFDMGDAQTVALAVESSLFALYALGATLS